MLPNTITLSVNTDNDENIVNQVYNRFRELTPDRTVYSREGTSPSARDELTFSRVFPKKNGSFPGVHRPGIKLAQDTSVEGLNGDTLKTQIIADLSFSIPVGTSPELVLEFKQRLAAVLLDDTQVMDDLLTGMLV